MNSSTNQSVVPNEDSLFRKQNENIVASLATHMLIGGENYIPWKKSMEAALDFNNKLEFVKGRVPKPTDEKQQL